MPTQKLRKWTATEDKLLVTSVNQFLAGGAVPDYRAISKQISHRTPKQCRERYENSLQPDVKRGEWGLDETVALAKLMTVHGQNWAVVKEQLPNRTYNAIKKKGRKLLGEIVDRNSIPKGTSSKAAATWTETEFSALLAIHLDESIPQDRKMDYLFLALKLRTGRSEAEIERQLVQFCSCDFCSHINFEVHSHDVASMFSTSEAICFKDKWSLWKSNQVLKSLEESGVEKQRFKGTRRASTISTSSDSTMATTSTDSSKRRRLTDNEWKQESIEEEMFNLNMQPQETWFNFEEEVKIKQEPEFWNSFEWDDSLKDFDGNFFFPL